MDVKSDKLQPSGTTQEKSALSWPQPSTTLQEKSALSWPEPSTTNRNIQSICWPVTLRSIAVYNGSFGTRELGPALVSAIKAVYSKPENVSLAASMEMNRDDILYIIVCPAGVGRNGTLPKYYINWQLEFMIGDYDVDWYWNILRGALSNWEYSTFNMPLTKSKGITSVHVPPGFNETISTPEIMSGSYEYNDEGKDIDILFLGYCDAYPRRLLFRENCESTGLKTFFISNYDLNGMRGVIKRAKVCIQMAAKDIFPVATVRLNILLSNQACIVAEKSIDTEADDLYSKHGIAFVPYEDLVERACELVHNPELRKRMALHSYNWYRTERNWNKIIDFPALLPAI